MRTPLIDFAIQRPIAYYTTDKGLVIELLFKVTKDGQEDWYVRIASCLMILHEVRFYNESKVLSYWHAGNKPHTLYIEKIKCL